MGRRRQVSDREISAAAREVFLDRGPKAPVAMVAKKLGVSTATLFQRTGSKQQLMLMALQPERTVINEVERGVLPGVPVREQLGAVLIELNEYLGTLISGSVTLRAAGIEPELPEPTPQRLRVLLSHVVVSSFFLHRLCRAREAHHRSFIRRNAQNVGLRMLVGRAEVEPPLQGSVG